VLLLVFFVIKSTTRSKFHDKRSIAAISSATPTSYYYAHSFCSSTASLFNSICGFCFGESSGWLGMASLHAIHHQSINPSMMRLQILQHTCCFFFFFFLCCGADLFMSSLSSNCVGFLCIVDCALLLCNQSIHAIANSITRFFLSLFRFFGGCVGKIIMCLVLIFGRVNLDNFWDGVGSVVICSGY
jgi:hypothetical protein